MINLRKKVVFFFLVYLICFGGILSAAEALITTDQVTGYGIADYEFSVKGKTTKFALYNAIVPPDGDVVYPSKEAFISALEAKKQTLVNKQLFLNVEYEYAFASFVNGIAYYTVTYTVEDSSTLIVLPYPKFDNDKTGFLFGLKAKDTNLLGTFGELNATVYTSQNDGTLQNWDDREDHLEFDISKFTLLGTSISLNFVYERRKTTKPLGIYDFDLDWTGIKFLGTTLNLETEGNFDPSVSAQVFNYDVSWTGLKILGTNVNLATWADLKPITDFSVLDPTLYGFSFSYGPFRQNEGRYTLSSLVQWEENITNFTTETTLAQHDLKLFTRPLSFNIRVETNQKMTSETVDNVLLSSTLGTSFRLPLGLTWGTSFTAAVNFVQNTNPLQRYYEYENTLGNGGRIDYLSSKHKFRRGLVFSFKHVYRDYPQVEYDSGDYWYMESSATWFPFIVWRFNPSIRLTGFYAENVMYNFLPSDEDLNVADYFRGYLSRSSKIAELNNKLSYGGVMNLNMTVDFIDFGFAKSYANPFLDVGVFSNPSEPNGRTVLASAGMEGWGVLKRFPSHPMRVALGFNLFDVYDALQGRMEPMEVEWELSVSFGLYF
jgi:hypothetical protein